MTETKNAKGTEPPTVEEIETGLLARIAKVLRRQDDDGYDDDDSPPSNGRVPYERLRRAIEERNALREELEDLGEIVEELRTAHTAALTEIRDEVAAEVKEIGTRHADDLALHDLGVGDPLGRAAVREAWGALPTDGRPKSASDWLRGLREALDSAAKDPKLKVPDVPRTLAAYLQGEAGGAGHGKSAATTAGDTKREPPPARGQPRQAPDIASLDVTDMSMDKFLSTLRGMR